MVDGDFSLEDFEVGGLSVVIDADGELGAVVDGVSGQVIVSVTDVSNWYIGSPNGYLGGPDDAVDVLPLAPSSLVTDNDFSAGETSLDTFSYAADLGKLVTPGSPNDFMIQISA